MDKIRLLNLNFNKLKTVLRDFTYDTTIVIKFIVLLSVTLSIENPLVHGNSDVTRNAAERNSNATNFDHTNGEWIDKALFEALTGYTPAASKSSAVNNSQCTNHGLLYRQHLRNLTMWAVQMYDSGVHSIGGIITADTYQLGHFDECLNVSYPVHNIKGRYCLVNLKFGPSYYAYKDFYSPPAAAYFEDPSSDSAVWNKIKKTLDPRMKVRNEIHLGVCVPSSCSYLDVQNSLNSTISDTFTNHSLYGEIYLDKSSCYIKDDDKPGTGYYIMLSVLMIIVLLSMAATIYDYFFKQKKQHEINISDPSNKYCYSNGNSLPVAERKPRKLEETVMTFSMKANMEELVSDGVDPSLDVLNGGKFICLAAIMLGHRTLYSLGSALYNPEYWEESVINMKHMALMNGTQVVDTFFLIGGFLAFRGVYSQLEKTKKFHLPLLVFFRWLRFLPVYLTMIGIYALLLIHLGSGPIWNMKVGVESENCRESWWLNVLFINNYINPEKQCLLMSWYLACDMHFFIIGSCIVFLLWRSQALGEIVCGVALACSLVIPFTQTYLGGHDGKLKLYQKLLMNPYVDKEFNSVYIRSHSRSIPYLCGIIFGYICHRINEAKFVIPRRINIAGISVFFILYIAQIYSLILYTPGRSYYVLENAILSAILPLSWSIGSGWILLVQSTTGLGFYKWLFAQKIYTPLSRLSYCAVLIHPAVQVLHVSSNVSSEYLTYCKLIWMTFGDLTTSYMLALVLYLLVEAPFKNLQKLFLQPGGRKRENNGVQKVQKSSEEEENNHQQATSQIIPMTISLKLSETNNHHNSSNGIAANDNR